MNNRKIDSFFSGSIGSQLCKITLLSLVIIIFYILFSGLDPHNIITLFIDPGSIDSSNPWGPQLILTLLGFILFSVLLSSAITAWITNINDNIRSGRRRYKLSGHIIVLGGGRQLDSILKAIDFNKFDILVIAKNPPKTERKNVIFYEGKIDDEKLIYEACVPNASEIYIIGEDHESGHDSISLRCLDLINKVTLDTKGSPIHCYITFEDFETTEVFQSLRNDAAHLSSRLLLVDAINEYEYLAEQLVLNTDFVPVLKKDSLKQAHFILIGTGKVSRAIAYTIAHACHYPNIDRKMRKTIITIIAPNAVDMRNQLMLARPFLFEASYYETIDNKGTKSIHQPDKDILDIEWRFVEGSLTDSHVQLLFANWVKSPILDNRVVVCNENSLEAIPNALHLPYTVYGRIPIAIYLEDSADIIIKANNSISYGGDLTIFGPASDDLSDPLLHRRSECGQRVNYIYELSYTDADTISCNPDVAWYHRSEADKLSSIYCALGLPLREKTFNFDTDIQEVYEAEHRRWMMSEFLMGFRYGKVRDKLNFTHNDLIPYDELSEEEKQKDAILIDNKSYILYGVDAPKL